MSGSLLCSFMPFDNIWWGSSVGWSAICQGLVAGTSGNTLLEEIVLLRTREREVESWSPQTGCAWAKWGQGWVTSKGQGLPGQDINQATVREWGWISREDWNKHHDSATLVAPDLFITCVHDSRNMDFKPLPRVLQLVMTQLQLGCYN